MSPIRTMVLDATDAAYVHDIPFSPVRFVINYLTHGVRLVRVSEYGL